MPAMFCLPPKDIDKFKEFVNSSERDADGFPVAFNKLAEMTSEERNKFLIPIVGGEANAKGVNALFEAKLLLKNQKLGLLNWAKRLSGVAPEVRRDLEARINKIDSILSPAQEEAFLKDLASARMGVDVTFEEAKRVSDLSNKVIETRTKWEQKQEKNPELKKFKNWHKDEDRLAWGAARYDLGDYVADLKLAADKPTLRGTVTHPGHSVTRLAGFSKALKAALDVSFTFRQGWKSMFNHPTLWAKNNLKSYSDYVKIIAKGKDFAKQLERATAADILSNPYYAISQKGLDANGRARRLAVTNQEEAIPTSAPEKIYGLGRAFKGSEVAFTGFQHRMRMDVFTKLAQVMEDKGLDINDRKIAGSIATLTNSLTNRGDMGKVEHISDTVNKLFFAPRNLKSHFDMLAGYQQRGDINPEVRKVAAYHALRAIAGTALVMALMRMLLGDDAVELDPRSADFGKVKVGNTRFDITGGVAGVATLASRLTTGKTKSTTSGELKNLGNKPGETSGQDLVVDFFNNKLSPVARVVSDQLKGENADGEKPNLISIAKNLLIPLPIQNQLETNDENAANSILIGIADALGIAANTYGESEVKWEKSDSKEIKQFRAKIGEAKFKQAIADYNKAYDDWYNGKREVAMLPPKKDVPKEQWPGLIKRAKNDIEKMIFNQYDFKYEKSPEEKAAAKAAAKERARVKKLRGY